METYFNNLSPGEGTPGKLLRDLRVLKQDTEELFATARGKMAARSKERFLLAMDKLRETCLRAQAKAMSGAKNTDQAIHDYPYSAMGMAFGVGLVVGVLAIRRR